jgi:predicted ATPase
LITDVTRTAASFRAPPAALGRDEPWRDAGFIDAITLLQRERQEQPAPPATTVQVFDRSPLLCTPTLARYLGLPVTPVLARDVDRVVAEEIYTSTFHDL